MAPAQLVPRRAGDARGPAAERPPSLPGAPRTPACFQRARHQERRPEFQLGFTSDPKKLQVDKLLTVTGGLLLLPNCVGSLCLFPSTCKRTRRKVESCSAGPEDVS